MKKTRIAVAAAAALTTSAFAEITFGGWGRAIWAPVASMGGDAITFTSTSWGGDGRIGFGMDFTSENVDMHADFKLEEDNAAINDQLKVVVRPIENLSISIGKLQDDTLRGDCCYGSWNWLRPNWLGGMSGKSYKAEDEGLTFSRTIDLKGVAVKATPVEGLVILAGIPVAANKYGDERRTRLMNLNYKGNEEDAEPIEKKELLIHFTNLGNLYTQESTTLMTTRRGGKGTKIKLAKNEAIIQTINDDNFSTLLAFSNKGKMYSINIDDLPINSKINIQQLFNFELGEKITKCTSITRKNETKYFVFITKNGMIKKTSTNEYEHRRGKSLKAINLKDNDEVIDVLFVDNEKVGILTFNGNFVIINTEDINPIGRATSGIKAIKLNPDDYVINSHIIKNNDKLLITVSKNGLIKKTSIDEFDVCNRNIKGRRISETKDNDSIVDFLTLDKESDIIISANKNIIKINTNELRLLSRDAVGVKSITLNDNDYILSILQS